MSTEEVAEYLHWPTSRIDNLCSQGRIPYYKDGGRRIFVRQEIDAWVRGLDRVTVQEAWALVP
jgi:excisionase family DNA binding protein